MYKLHGARARDETVGLKPNRIRDDRIDSSRVVAFPTWQSRLLLIRIVPIRVDLRGVKQKREKAAEYENAVVGVRRPSPFRVGTAGVWNTPCGQERDDGRSDERVDVAVGSVVGFGWVRAAIAFEF